MSSLIINYTIILKLLTHLCLDFMVSQKYRSQEFLIRAVVSYSGSPFYNLNKCIANILKAYGKDEITTPRTPSRFPTASEMFRLKMTK